ncbi:MAG TPA: hypothetical protein VFV40_05045 [Nocardioides sp.]|nr:hypothetical protein [Nocardioides sp.]
MVLAALVAVLLPLGVVTTAQGAPGGGGNATSVRFTSIVDADTSLPDTPGTQGLAYVVQGETFDVALAFLDRQGRPAPLSSSSPTLVTVALDGQSLGTTEVQAGAVVATVAAAGILDAARDVRLTAVAATSPRPLSGVSDPFDVLLESVDVTGTTSVGDTTDDGCDPNPGRPVCGDLVPPANGFVGSAYLSLADCVALRTDARDCKQSYVQPLLDFVPAAGSLPPPATLLMKCDKTLCGGGAINKKVLKVTLSSDPDSEFYGVDVTAPACPAKGVVAYDPARPYEEGNRPFCTDYVQSTRDVAGDTILVLVFVVDAKVRFL